jgi:uncharacterized damage-inducible protein DinB
MDQTTDAVFQDFSAKKLQQLCARIQDCTGKLSQEQIWMRGGEGQNAIGNLILHLSGNVRQWIVASLGGKPDIRERDAEFSTRGEVSGPELVAGLRTIVEEAAAVILDLPRERLLERVTIQKYNATVLEAIYHVVAHFSEHTGQILYATKLLTGQDLGFYRHLKAESHSERTP